YTLFSMPTKLSLDEYNLKMVELLNAVNKEEHLHFKEDLGLAIEKRKELGLPDQEYYWGEHSATEEELKSDIVPNQSKVLPDFQTILPGDVANDFWEERKAFRENEITEAEQALIDFKNNFYVKGDKPKGKKDAVIEQSDDISNSESIVEIQDIGDEITNPRGLISDGQSGIRQKRGKDIYHVGEETMDDFVDLFVTDKIDGGWFTTKEEAFEDTISDFKSIYKDLRERDENGDRMKKREAKQMLGEYIVEHGMSLGGLDPNSQFQMDNNDLGGFNASIYGQQENHFYDVGHIVDMF
ncbi:MAG: hypothetical protein VXX44_01100, partial [Bacteroidota bacterium]|nr:hypothetical protein [Bacteroidota bacterium]